MFPSVGDTLVTYSVPLSGSALVAGRALFGWGLTLHNTPHGRGLTDVTLSGYHAGGHTYVWNDVRVDQEQAMKDVQAAVRRHRAAQKRLDDAHQHLREVLRAARDAGVKQVDLVKATGYTREHVRRLLLPPKRKDDRS